MIKDILDKLFCRDCVHSIKYGVADEHGITSKWLCFLGIKDKIDKNTEACSRNFQKGKFTKRRK